MKLLADRFALVSRSAKLLAVEPEVTPNRVVTCDTVKSVTLAVEPVLLPLRVLAGACARNLLETFDMIFSFLPYYRQAHPGQLRYFNRSIRIAFLRPSHCLYIIVYILK